MSVATEPSVSFNRYWTAKTNTPSPYAPNRWELAETRVIVTSSILSALPAIRSAE
ncbi:MAG: hypothetical protein ABL985_03050 [Casimicrobium sp.]